MTQEVLTLALEALETAWYHVGTFCPTDEAIDLYDEARAAIKEALAKEQDGQCKRCTDGCPACDARKLPKQEPVALQYPQKDIDWQREQQIKAQASTPPQRTWVGLDPEEIRKTNHHMVEGAYHYSFKQGAEWAEAKLKEKNA